MAENLATCEPKVLRQHDGPILFKSFRLVIDMISAEAYDLVFTEFVEFSLVKFEVGVDIKPKIKSLHFFALDDFVVIVVELRSKREREKLKYQ